jgi:hypothetical protein
MPKYEVDIQQINYGYITIEAKNEQEAMELIRKGQFVPDEIYTGSKIIPLKVQEAY